MKDLPTPNEEEKKIKKLIKKFNKVAEAYTQIYLRQIKRAEKNFKKGYRGEAFVGLEAVLEFQMHLLWQFFLSNSTKELNLSDESLGFPTYTEILWQIGYISTSQRSDLKAFHIGRNTIVHYVSKHFQKGHPSDKTLDDQFKKGLKVSDELTNMLKFPKLEFESKDFIQENDSKR